MRGGTVRCGRGHRAARPRPASGGTGPDHRPGAVRGDLCVRAARGRRARDARAARASASGPARRYGGGDGRVPGAGWRTHLGRCAVRGRALGAVAARRHPGAGRGRRPGPVDRGGGRSGRRGDPGGDDRALGGGTAGSRRRTGGAPGGRAGGVRSRPRRGPYRVRRAPGRGVRGLARARGPAHRHPRAVRAPALHQPGRPASRRRRPHGHRGDPGHRVRGRLAARRPETVRGAGADRRLVGIGGGQAGRPHGPAPARGYRADLDHPVHRHFLWGRQLDAYLGCGGEALEELGLLLAAGRQEEAS